MNSDAATGARIVGRLAALRARNRAMTAFMRCVLPGRDTLSDPRAAPALVALIDGFPHPTPREIITRVLAEA